MTPTENQVKNAFLRQRQGLPLHIKLEMTFRRIRQWYEMWDGQVYVSFSGGADSTVLLMLVRALYPDVPAVFVDTGVEYPEIREFVRTVQGVVWLKPRMTFKEVTQRYGYPVVSKETAQKLHEVRTTKSEFMMQLRTTGVEGRERQRIPAKWKFLIDAPFKISHKCCAILKHEPFYRYERETGRKGIVGTMATESARRTQDTLEHGCFRLGGNHPLLRPLSFWTPADTHAMLPLMPHCVLYDPPYNLPRTGCIICGFGADQNNPNKFQILKQTHPRLHAKGLPAFGIDKVLDFMGVPYE